MPKKESARQTNAQSNAEHFVQYFIDLADWIISRNFHRCYNATMLLIDTPTAQLSEARTG